MLWVAGVAFVSWQTLLVIPTTILSLAFLLPAFVLAVLPPVFVGARIGLGWAFRGRQPIADELRDRPDLADRAIFLTLEPIPNDKRKLEAEMWAAFEVVRPRILGALLDAVATGLKRSPEIRLKRLPRMADFAIWATACETALRHDGTCWA